MTTGDTAFIGENKPLGAVFTYFLLPSERKKPEEKEQEQPQDAQRRAMMERMRQMAGRGMFGRMGMMRQGSSRVQITITDSSGKVINRMNGTENKGLNRITWNFTEQTSRQRSTAPRRGFFGFRGGGLTVLPGEYTVTIKYDGEEVSQKFTVKPDPRIPVDRALLEENYRMGKKALKLSEAINAASRQIQETQESFKTFFEYVRKNRSPKTKELVQSGRTLEKKLKEFAEILNPTPPKQGIADRSAGLRTQVMRAVSGITRAGYNPITQAARVKYERVRGQAAEFLEKLNAFYQTDMEAFKKKLKDADFSFFGAFSPIKIEDQD